MNVSFVIEKKIEGEWAQKLCVDVMWCDVKTVSLFMILLTSEKKLVINQICNLNM